MVIRALDKRSCQCIFAGRASQGKLILTYSKVSMARTSLGPWECIQDIGSSSNLGLTAPGQEANCYNLGKSV